VGPHCMPTHKACEIRGAAAEARKKILRRGAEGEDKERENKEGGGGASNAQARPSTGRKP